VKGCEHKKADEPEDVDVKPVETPTVVEKGPIVIDDIKAPNNADAPRPNLIDVIGALKKEDENHKDKDVPANLIDGIENIFKPFLVNGQPGAQDDPVFIEIKPIDEEDDDEEESKDGENSSSVEASKEKPEEETPSNFGFLNPFKLASIVSSVIERAKSKIGSGNFRYYAKFLENGTVLESFEKPSESNEAMRLDDNDEAPFKIINAMLNDHRLAGEDVDEEHRHAGLHPNWKGRPLPIGQPIIENLDEFNRPPPFRMYRECRPIKFQFSTLCHDINNFFNCASMRTGLPRWFFMSLILLCSFFMLWLGIFILSMIRRMKRQEVSTKKAPTHSQKLILLL
jgi:Brain specific membrane anchored protein